MLLQLHLQLHVRLLVHDELALHVQLRDNITGYHGKDRGGGSERPVAMCRQQPVNLSRMAQPSHGLGEVSPGVSAMPHLHEDGLLNAFRELELLRRVLLRRGARRSSHRSGRGGPLCGRIRVHLLLE